MDHPSKRSIIQFVKIVRIPIRFKDMRRPSILIESYAFAMSCVKIHSSLRYSFASFMILFKTFNGVTVDSSFNPQKLCPVRIWWVDKMRLNLLVTIFVRTLQKTSNNAIGQVLLILYENFSGFEMGIIFDLRHAVE